MTRRTTLSLQAAALVLALSGPAGAFEHTVFQPLEVTAMEDGVVRRVPAVLNLPTGWRAGDAAAVLLFDQPDTPGLHDALLVALLDAGSAVLELDSATAHGFSADSAANPPAPTPASLALDLAGALAALRDQGAGPVVAIGNGLGGQVALLAPAGGRPGFSAVASLGPDTPVFLAGGPGAQAPSLCDVMDFAMGSLPTPQTPRLTTARLEATGRACRDALRPTTLARAAPGGG